MSKTTSLGTSFQVTAWGSFVSETLEKALPEINREGSVEIKDCTTNRTRDIIEQIEFTESQELSMNSRHEVTEENRHLIKKLQELERKYWPDAPGGIPKSETEYQKCLSIRYTASGIEIGGCKLKYKNELAAKNEEEGITDYSLFTWKAAMKKYAEKIPSSGQWADILDVIPGRSDKTHHQNATDILNIPYAGRLDSSGSFVDIGQRAMLWSSSKNGIGCADAVCLFPADEGVEMDWYLCTHFFSVRLLAD